MKYFMILICFLIITCITVSAQIIHVPGDYSTIQAGIDAAQNGDMVLVDDGTYLENINFKGKAITVASNFIMNGDTNHINNTIIDGSQPSHPDSGSVVSFVSGEDTTSILCGLTITGGTGTYYTAPDRRIGGGINCNFSGARICHSKIIYNTITFNSGIVTGGGISLGSSDNTSWLILENNVIRNNSILGNGGGGGGIFVFGNVKLSNNVVEYNIAESIGNMIWGGGISLGTNYVITSYNWFVIDNTIRYNKAIAPSGTANNGGVGGGLAIFGASHSVIIRNNEITYNEVQGNSPIADCHGGGVILQNQNESCIFSENYVAHNKALGNSFCKGAGISIWSFNATVEPQLYNNIIVNNTNGNIGGGIFIGGSGTYTNEPVLFNNTITQNSATFGGAVYSDQSSPLIINSILWNNGTEIYYSGGQIEVHYSDIEGGWAGTGSNNINVDPFFVDPTYNLADSSRCIGAGIDSIEINGIWYYAPLFDIDGDPRPDPPGTMPDIGAYESPLDSPVYVEKYESLIPIEYALHQNYPNPFNPSTTIEFALPTPGYVILSIFNILGEKVATLVSENLVAGSYKFYWDAIRLTSGVYFYQLRADNYVETKKMILLR